MTITQSPSFAPNQCHATSLGLHHQRKLKKRSIFPETMSDEEVPGLIFLKLLLLSTRFWENLSMCNQKDTVTFTVLAKRFQISMGFWCCLWSLTSMSEMEWKLQAGRRVVHFTNCNNFLFFRCRRWSRKPVVLKLFGSWATFVFQKPVAGHKN